ncbi:MAG: hypothetical protein ACR2IV_10885 [Bryobacteraceae bacterium]
MLLLQLEGAVCVILLIWIARIVFINFQRTEKREHTLHFTRTTSHPAYTRYQVERALLDFAQADEKCDEAHEKFKAANRDYKANATKEVREALRYSARRMLEADSTREERLAIHFFMMEANNRVLSGLATIAQICEEYKEKFATTSRYLRMNQQVKDFDEQLDDGSTELPVLCKTEGDDSDVS